MDYQTSVSDQTNAYSIYYVQFIKSSFRNGGELSWWARSFFFTFFIISLTKRPEWTAKHHQMTIKRMVMIIYKFLIVGGRRGQLRTAQSISFVLYKQTMCFLQLFDIFRIFFLQISNLKHTHFFFDDFSKIFMKKNADL